MGEPPPPTELPPRQALAARLLVRGWTQSAVAKHLRVDRHTVGEWCRRDDFRGAVERAAREEVT